MKYYPKMAAFVKIAEETGAEMLLQYEGSKRQVVYMGRIGSRSLSIGVSIMDGREELHNAVYLDSRDVETALGILKGSNG